MTKKAIIFNQLLTATFVLMLFACKKGVIEKQAEPLSGKKSSSLMTLTPPDVYVAGSEGGQAKYWVNGSAVTLTGGAQATDIVVDGSDVHVCGFGQDPITGIFIAKYWLNGVATDLSDGSSDAIAFGIAVSGGDVYIAGRTGVWSPMGVVWVNGVETQLGSGQPMGIFAAANGDIYVPNGEVGNPSYWKNGTLNTLTGPSNAVVYDIAVSGSDVHAVGFEANGPSEYALHWKNNSLQSLVLNTPDISRAMAIAINGSGQSYISGIAGDSTHKAQISRWDAVGDLTTTSSGFFVATRTGIAIDAASGDLYICGSETDVYGTGPTRARYWVVTSGGSTTQVNLGSGLANATALAITLN